MYVDSYLYYVILYLIGGFISAGVYCKWAFMDARDRNSRWDSTKEAQLLAIFLVVMALWLPGIILFSCFMVGAFIAMLLIQIASFPGKALRHLFKIKLYSEVYGKGN